VNKEKKKKEKKRQREKKTEKRESIERVLLYCEKQIEKEV